MAVGDEDLPGRQAGVVFEVGDEGWHIELLQVIGLPKLFGIMILTGNDFNRPLCSTIDQSVLVVYSPAPKTFQVAF